MTVSPRPVTPECSVAGQITPDDLATLKALGFAGIICNRPDGEEPGQPTFAEIAAEAETLGMRAVHIPVHPALGIGAGEVAALRDAWEELPKPVFAYCRSGARSGNLLMAAGLA